MYRTLITAGLSVLLGIASTLIYQRVTVHITEPPVVVAQVACPDMSEGLRQALQPLDTTYTPQGRLLSLQPGKAQP